MCRIDGRKRRIHGVERDKFFMTSRGMKKKYFIKKRD